MKPFLGLFILFFLGMPAFIQAHPGNLSPGHSLHSWHVRGEKAPVRGHFLYSVDGKAVIQTETGAIQRFPLERLTEADRKKIAKKSAYIQALHTNPSPSEAMRGLPQAFTWSVWALLALFVGGLVWIFQRRRRISMAYPLAAAICLQASLFLLSAFGPAIQAISTTDPQFVESAFKPFKPQVATSWNDQYFFVSSLGIPDHQMMVGITKWQQQVPIPQCYTGDNSWPIPLNPELAAEPLAIEQHFMKGAVAIAANGIPIFNARNNTGLDSYLAGELDEFGGHCGRADDYHYHIAPLHLEGKTTAVLPIGFALDGYALYGSKEPDGSAMKPLDANHGHFGSNGVYHYHGTKVYPYSVGKMVGKVTLDPKTPAPEDQILPQAFASPVRPALPGLNGAKITGFEANGTQGYRLSYQLNAQNYQVNYSWTKEGKFQFDFVNPNGTSTSQTYTGKTLCTLPAQSVDSAFTLSSPVIGADSLLPTRYTCWGAGINPPLQWKNAPSGTTCFVALMHHFDKDKVEKTYMILYDIQGSINAIKENETSVGKWGGNTQNNLTAYSPPCSQGGGLKAYYLTVYALKQCVSFTTTPKTRQEVLAKIQGFVLDSASMTTLYDNTAQPPATPWQFKCSELLGRPTDRSVTLNMMADAEVELYVEYGTKSGTYSQRTPSRTYPSSLPFDLELAGLAADTRYYYRVQARRTGETAFQARPERSFHTQRKKGSSFTFVIQADPHLDEQSDTLVYKTCLQNQLADQPDFMVDLGDFLMSDKLVEPNYQKIEDRSLLMRSYYDISGHSVPLFIALGNHEGEAGWTLNGTPDNVAIWNTLARKKYFPNPIPNGFYTGDTVSYALVGQRENYYAWEWGDALFIVLDPYWYTTVKPTRDNWYWTLGKAQYDWLKKTLEGSTATFKFVFAHTLIGGSEAARGGVEFANLYEWGGQNNDGTPGFQAKRPGWYKPIHQLLTEHRATIFFHGHDHFYANQQLDCMGYQLVPQPSHPQFVSANQAQDYGYLTGKIIPNAGHLRVNVSPDAVKVEYVRAYKPANETTTRKNRDVSDSYTIRRGDCFVTAVEESSMPDGAVQVYPNPSKDKFFVELSPEVNPANLYLTLRNLLGQPIPVHIVSGIHALECSTDGLAPGIYFLEIYDENTRKKEITRVIKQ